MENIIGKTINRYEISGEIGRGGLAIVYRASDTVLGRTVAIKMINITSEEKNERYLRRFQREAKTLAQLSHPNIVKVLDYGEYEGVPYLVMEYISGGTLSSRMGKPMPYTEAATLLAPIARAIQHAHQRKVVHRDIKPANILFNESGQPMLSDFGIAKLTDSDESQSLTGTGAIVGTPSYMAPEQIQGKLIDGRADIYALGIVLFELVTGRKPYMANTPLEVTMKHLTDPLPHAKQFNREIPQEMEHVLLKAMAKKPENRFQDMGIFADVLEKLAAGQKSAVRAASRVAASAPVEVLEKKTAEDSKKKLVNKTLVIIGAIIMLALSVSAVFLSNAFSPKSGEPDRAAATATDAAPATIAIAEVAAPPLSTETKSAPTKTPTLLPPTETPAPTATPIIGQISAQNASQVMDLGPRLDNVSVKDMYWSGDGKTVLVGGTSVITLINPATMKSDGVISLANNVPTMIRTTSDSKQVAALIGNTVKYYSLSDRQLGKTITFQGGANSMALSFNDKLLALGMPSNKVLLIDTESQRVVRTLSSNPGGWSVAFSPDGKWIAAGTSKGTRIWEVETGIVQPISTGTNDLIQVVAFSHSGKWMASAGKGIIRIWDVETLQEVMLFQKDFGTIKTMAFSPDDSLLITGGDDAKLRIWDLNGQEEAQVIEGHKSPIFGVLFSPDGRLIISGANEGIIHMFGIP